MKKKRTTKSKIMSQYDQVIEVGYCRLQTLLNYEDPTYYVTAPAGWRADVYIFDRVAIVTGYAPFGSFSPSYDLTEGYEWEARSILDNYYKEMANTDYETVRQSLRDLIQKFIEEVTK